MVTTKISGVIISDVSSLVTFADHAIVNRNERGEAMDFRGFHHDGGIFATDHSTRVPPSRQQTSYTRSPHGGSLPCISPSDSGAGSSSETSVTSLYHVMSSSPSCITYTMHTRTDRGLSYKRKPRNDLDDLHIVSASPSTLSRDRGRGESTHPATYHLS